MGKHVTNGAMLQCSMGMAPGTLTVLPVSLVQAGSVPAATIMDFVPMMNIMPFGMCMSMANPMVAAATSAALGVLTPMPCIPVTTSPWSPGSPTIKINNFPVLLDSDTCQCSWAGAITITFPGQATVDGT